VQIFDIYYKSDRKVYLDLLNEETSELSTIPLENYRFNLRLSQVKRCPGYFRDGEYHKCIRRNVLGDKETICSDCEEKIGFKVAFFMGGKPNAFMEEYLKKPHHLYLAYFEPGLLKVGTANIEKGERRLLEQDAQFYAFVDTADGFVVQKKEKEASILLNLTTSVKSVHKSKYLGKRSVVDDVKETFYSKFSILGLKKRPEIVDLTSSYFYPVEYDIVENNLNVVGVFQGLRGRYLIFENNGYQVIDINYIIGRNIEEYLEDYKYLREMTLFDL
jgi:hypothetical protein